MEAKKTYLLFGPRVSEATKQALRAQLGYEEIPADFGPFNSGAPFCELFPFYKQEREALKRQHPGLSKAELKELFEARYEAQKARLAGAHVIFVQSTGEQPDVANSIEQTRFAINSLTHYGAAEITVAMPNVAYDRQDRGFNEAGRLCSLGSKWLAMDLKNYGASRLITFTPHSEDNIKQWKDTFGEAHYHHLLTTELFAEHIRAAFPQTQNLIFGAPDGADKKTDQGIARARKLAASVMNASEQQAGEQLFTIQKDHLGKSDTKCELVSGDVAGKDCVLVDDMSDGGGTLLNAAAELKKHGAKSVSVYFTHAICSNNSLDVLATNRNIDRIVTTDTVPEILTKRESLVPALGSKIEVLTVGPLLAKSLQQIIAQEKPGTAINGELSAAGYAQARIIGH